MKRKVIQLKESELKRLISKIIEEQTASNAFTQGQTLGMVQGQQARKAVNQVASNAVKGLKETVVTILKVSFKIVIIGGAVVYLIGNGIYKIGAAAHNAILKFIAASGKAVIKTFNQISQNTINSFNKIGVAFDKGMNVVNQKLATLKDSTVSIAKWAINSFKQFGTQQWAKVLVAAAGIKEFAGLVGDHLKNSWASIQNQVGVAWDQASNWAKGQYNAAVQGVKNTANAAVQGAKNVYNQTTNAIKNKAGEFAQSAANVAGKTLGAIQGFLSEMYERYLSFSNDTESILSEAVAFNGKEIL
jgi:hypothetical protein